MGDSTLIIEHLGERDGIDLDARRDPQAYDTVAQARARLGRFLDVYNNSRTHQALGRLTPDEINYHGLRQAA